MNTEHKFEKEPDLSNVYSPLNPKLLEYGAPSSYYIKSGNGFVLYANQSKQHDISERNEQGTLPQLYVESTYKKLLYVSVAEHYLENLRKVLSEKIINRKEVVNILVDWIDISLIEMGVEGENMAFEQLNMFVTELIEGYGEGNIISLLHEVKALDYSSAQHSVEMMIFTLSYFESLPKESTRLNIIGSLSALLHDIGKKNIRKELLLKPGPLNDKEYEEAQLHVNLGMNILKKIEFEKFGFSQDEIRMILCGAYEHHEREDGSGYPRGINKREISIFGKIMAVLDIYTATTTDTRSYRRAVSQNEALDILKSEVTKGRINGDVVKQLEIALKMI